MLQMVGEVFDVVSLCLENVATGRFMERGTPGLFRGIKEA